ncbi:MAG: hypothetical protein IH623_19085 [Verrucomicrobia bacterium]|nr:hypothetical protein [Verrucomicrobiota bacterium]
MKNGSVNSVKLIRAIVPDTSRIWQRRKPAPQPHSQRRSRKRSYDLAP